MGCLFVTQELVTAICASLYAVHLLERDVDSEVVPEEFQRVAFVSTYFFHGMLPYIWESVTLWDLYRRGLIPVYLIQHYGQVQLCVSGPISRKTMSRFHFYAPYIKVFRVPHGSTDADRIDNWKPLVEYSKDNGLLPNLVELKCKGFNPPALSVFLCPSTQKLTIDPPKGAWDRLDMARSRQLLEHIAPRCPSLRSLEFYPELTESDDIPTLPRTFASLSSFKDLRRLVSTPVVIQSSALQLVAQLPRLESLSIGPNAGGRHWDSSLCEPVPAGGFPALNDLTLCVEKARDATRFWELIPLRMLKKLDLTILVPRNDGSPLISTLCRASPQIAELGLRFGESKRSYWSPYNISADMFGHLACLPIESSYSFGSMEFAFEGAWARVAASWPNLRHIECLAQPTDLEDLVFLSSNLPKLESIGCNLNLNNAAYAIESNWSPVGRPPFYPHLRHLILDSLDMRNTADYESDDEERTLDFRGLARFLAYFWPRLSIKAIEEDSMEYDSNYSRDYNEMRTLFLASQAVSVTLFKALVQTYVELYHEA